MIRNLFILNRSCNKGGCSDVFCAPAPRKKCDARSDQSCLHNHARTGAPLGRAWWKPSQRSARAPLRRAVGDCFFFTSNDRETHPAPVGRSRSRRRRGAAAGRRGGEDAGIAVLAPPPCRSNQRLFSPPPNDSPLLPGTLARRNDCERLISGVLTAVRPW